MKTPKKLLPLLAASLLYASVVSVVSVASAATVTDSVNICAGDGSPLYTATFAVPELKGDETVIKIGNAYLDMKYRRFLQKCKSLETDAYLIYEAWKAGAAENDSFGKSSGQKGSASGGKSSPGYAMSTEPSDVPTRGTISFVTKEVTSIIGQSNAITYAATFDRSTGRRLSLADAFRGDKAIADKIAVYVQHYLPISPYKDSLSGDFTAHVYEFCSAPIEDGWYISGDNLIVIYPAAAITTKPSGEVLVAVPLKELEKK